MGEIAGANTASLGGCLRSTKTRARWMEGFHELNGYVFDLERDGLRQAVLCPRLNGHVFDLERDVLRVTRSCLVSLFKEFTCESVDMAMLTTMGCPL